MRSYPMDDDECLLHWHEPEKERKIKTKLHVSRHDPNPQLVNSSFGKKQISKDPTRKIRTKTKPPVPKRRDAPVKASTTKKNFVMANAIETILSTPKAALKGPDFRYVQKDEYGKIPKYLGKVKAEIAEEERIIREEFEKQRERELIQEGKVTETLMTEETRLDMLRKLKAKWDECNVLYQRQTHVVNLDTQGKIKRKEILEKKLKSIEAAIVKLEKGPVTIVRKD